MKALFVSFLLIASQQLFSQVYHQNKAKKIIPQSTEVRMNKTTKSIEFIRFDSAVHFARKTDIKTELNNILALKSGYNFDLKNKERDNLGFEHQRYQLRLNGITVDNKEYIVRLKSGRLYSANGKYSVTKKTSARTPSISESTALYRALNYMNGEKYIWQTEKDGKLPVAEIVYVEDNDVLILAYKFDIYSVEPLDRKFVYINAQTGEVVKAISRIQDIDRVGSALTRYNGTQFITADSVNGYFRLLETGRGIETYNMQNQTDYYTSINFTDTDNIWTDPVHNVAFDVHFGAEMTYDYFLSEFGRNSFDGTGSKIKSYVHYGYNYSNAFWNGTCFTYGDGNGYQYNPFTSIDIVAHEITHAFTQYTANLEYINESGALNESFSDIFGVVIDFYARPDQANYLMGEEISLTGTPIRSMENPNSLGDPDTYHGTYWQTGSADNGGVHTNSGVQNYWFYLLTEGGSGVNDLGDYYSVTGIGIKKAAQIAYRNLTYYLTPGSDYADARYYAVQAATDLFGPCSQEVISTTNAWYAVGIGEKFTNSVTADFSADKLYSCELPAPIQFTNLSTNAASCLWNFGDGNTSNLTNPQHVYNDTGKYTIRLDISGTAACGSSDSAVKTDYLYIKNNGSPVPAACTPSTIYPGTTYGIFEVNFGPLNNISQGSVAGYEDFTCNHYVSLKEGKKYPAAIRTGSSTNEDVYIWLDKNNDGVFNANERLLSSFNQRNHQADITIPRVTAYNTPLRLRIGSELSGSDSLYHTGCKASNYGQYEDYSVFITQNTEKPACSFNADSRNVSKGGYAKFFDLSENLPVSWQWSFPGGTPSSSSIKNPVVRYATPGNYDVTLIVQNLFGSDTLVRRNYITVSDPYIMCVDDSSNSTTGTFFDSGGPSGTYKNNENCQFLINIPCAKNITLTFKSFQLESCCDYFRVYDGKDISAPLLLTANGSSLPSPVKSTAGSLFITFTSNVSGTYQGFEISWDSELSTPVGFSAAFSVTDTTPPLGTPVKFNDKSGTSVNQWFWDFDDGSFSYEQNPVHAFTATGAYHVKLIADNCFLTDTASLDVTVQQAPVMELPESSLNISSDKCSGTINYPFSIKNTGAGDLHAQIAPSSKDISDTCSTKYVTISGETTFHNISIDNHNLDSVTVEITINGDYDYPSEFATVFFESNSYGQIQDNDVENGTDITRTYRFPADSLNKWLADNTLTVSIQNSPDVDIYGDHFHRVCVTSYRSALIVSKSDTLIHPAENTTLQLNLLLDGLEAGTYRDTLIITSNDPARSKVQVPVTLNLNGSAYMEFTEPEWIVDTAMVGSSASDSIKIDNTGCDDLVITGTSGTSSVFHFPDLPMLIKPGKSGYLKTVFSPSGITDYDETLTLQTSIGDESIQIKAYGEGIPVMNLSRDGIDTLFNQCGATANIPLVIENSGEGRLNVTFSGPPVRDTAEFILKEDFSDLNYNGWNPGDAVQNIYMQTYSGNPFLTISGGGGSFNGLYRQIAQGEYDYVRVRIIPYDGYSSHGFFVIGDNNIESNSGIIHLMFFENNIQLLGTSISIPYSTNSWYECEFKNIDYSNKKYDFYLNGNLVRQGIDFLSPSNDVSEIHIFNYTVSSTGYDDIFVGYNSFCNWLNISSTPLRLMPGESDTINISLDASDLNNGDYYSYFNLKTNIPGQQTKTFPVNVNINGQSEFIAEKTVIDLDTVMQYSIAIDTVKLFNVGCAALQIDSVYFSDTDIKALHYLNSLFPKDSDELVVQFNPVKVQNYADTVFIRTDAGTEKIMFHAVTYGAPVARFLSDSIYLDVPDCSDSVVTQFKLINSGLSPLKFSFSTKPGNIQETFENGLDSTKWESMYGGTYGNSCGSMSGDALFFDQGSERKLTTQPIDFSNGGTIEFYLKISNGSLCESADYGENVVLEFSKDGITWTQMGLYLVGNYNSFTRVTASMPDIAYSKNTQVRWRQVSHSGYGYDVWTLDDISIMQKGHELRPAITSGSVPADDTLTIGVTVNTSELAEGTYQFSLMGNTNDPRNKEKEINFFVNLSGTPQLVSSRASLSFDPVMEYAVVTDSFYIYNNSCANADIQAVIYDTDNFSIGLSSPVPGWDSTLATITFHPKVTGIISGNLVIKSNAPDLIIPLSGNCYDAPEITISPDSFNEIIRSCDSTAEFKLEITNNGGSDLIIRNKINHYSDSISILAYTYGTDYDEEYQHTIQAISRYVTKFSLSETNTTTPSGLQSALEGKNVFLVPEQEQYVSPSMFSSFETVLQSFVNEGGTVIFCGTNSFSYISSTGLFSGSYYGDQYGSQLNIAEKEHFLTKNVSSPIYGQNATYLASITNDDKLSLVKYGTADVFALREIGKGACIYLGYDFYNFDDAAARFISNSVLFSTYEDLPDWLEIVSPDTIKSFSSGELTLRINSEKFDNDSVGCELTINSNDPLNPKILLPLSFRKSAAPCVYLPISEITYMITDSCTGEVSFSHISENEPDEFTWSFGDGETSSLENPVHIFKSSGLQTVVLETFNEAGSSSDTALFYIDIKSLMINVSGRYETNQALVFSLDDTTGVYNPLWFFGDDDAKLGYSVSHAYLTAGNFNIRIIANHPSGCEYEATKQILIDNPSDIPDKELLKCAIYPNPSDGLFFLKFAEPVDNLAIRLYNLAGRLVMEDRISVQGGTIINYDIENPEHGIYQLELRKGNIRVVYKLVVDK